MTIRIDPASLPMQNRARERDPAAKVHGVDAAARTVNVIFSTGAAVRRLRWTGWDSAVPFDEILTISREAINFDRLNAGAPALDSHSTWSTFSQVGVIERGWIEGTNALATIRFPKAGIDAAADRMFGLVSDDIIRNVSVGYTIDKVRIIAAAKAGEIEKRIAERWTPHEISWVTVPADADAQKVRGLDQLAQFPCQIARADAPLGIGASRARMRMRQAGAASIRSL